MPSDIRMLAEPAVLMSAPKISTNAGISNSPPATPSMLLTSPTPMPMSMPAISCTIGLAGAADRHTASEGAPEIGAGDGADHVSICLRYPVPALCRASTSSLQLFGHFQDVDGRD